MDKIFRRVMMYGMAIFFFASVLWILTFTYSNVYPSSMVPDELMYKERVDNFTIDHIRYLYNVGFETKTVIFLVRFMFFYIPLKRRDFLR